MAVVPVPAPTDPFANVRPRYVESSYPPHIDYSQLGGGASAFNICLVVALTALIMLGLAHVGPHFWDVVGTALEWVFGIALVIGFIALMTKYPNLARAVMAFSFLLIAVSWFVKEDDYDRRS